MKKIYSLLFALLFGSSLMVAQNVYWSENFENGFPAGWGMTGEWQHTNAAGISSQYFQPDAHTMFMGFNDDALVNQNGDNGMVTTSAIDMPDFTGVLWLSFQSFFPNGDFQGADETARISISTDSMATWTELANLQVSGFEWLQASVNVPDTYSGQTIHFAFIYDDGNQWNYGWCFDDLELIDPILRDVRFVDHNKEAFLEGAFVGAPIYPGGIIANDGATTITSVDMNITVNGTTTTQTISGLNIETGGQAFIQVTDPIIMTDGSVDIGVSIGNMNGEGDDENTDNDAGDDYTVTSVTPHPDRGVLTEEATGTWCTWCPRGTVFMDAMTQRYPGAFVGIAVHNQDPMADATYNGGVTGFTGFQGFPSVIFNRQNIIDPSALEQPFINAVTQAPVATLNIGANYDNASRELTVSVDALFSQNVPAGYKFNAVVVEDHVTGTGQGWDQVNAYSGGGPGTMDIFTIWPSPVPGSMLEYNHVGRKLLAGNYGGVTDGIEDGATAGQNLGTTFATYTIPAGYDTDHIHIAAMLISNTGSIANAKTATLSEAIANGLFTSAKEVFNHDLISVSPNPYRGSTNINLNLETTSEVSLQVVNTAGQVVAQRNYGEMSGAQSLPFNADLSEGVYFFHIRVDGQVATKRVQVIR